MKPHSETFIRKRRFLMVLPLLVTPFITMMFWALGGGQSVPAKSAAATMLGLNLSLPDAHFDTKEVWDKLSLYEIAQRDSNKFEEARENDPYFDLITFKTKQDQASTTQDSSRSKLIDAFQRKDNLSIDPNEDRVNRKLDQLYKEINSPSSQGVHNDVTGSKNKSAAPTTTTDPQFTQDVDRLEEIMEMMKESPEADPEMQQIESVLEKILDIQHPERIQQKLKTASDVANENTVPVETVADPGVISIMECKPLETLTPPDSLLATPYSQTNGFFGLDEELARETPHDNTIQVVIHDTQELVSGSTVKMRLVQDIQIKDHLIPKDQFIYGTCSINGERLKIEIMSIRTESSIIPVSLSIYDLDGIEGIFIPGAITRDAAKQATDNSIQNVQLMNLDASLAAQTATAGVEVAKGLFSKKAKLIKITVKAGYQLFLKDLRAMN